MRLTALIVAAIFVGAVVGAIMALKPAAPASQGLSEKTPQQRIDEVFDELGFQRLPLPPGVPRR